MTATEAALALPPSERRRLLVTALVRSAFVTTALVVAYFVLPLDRLSGTPLWLVLCVGLLVLAAMLAYQLLAITRSAHPGVRAIEALATVAPLFLLLFASTYYQMSHSDAGNFSAHPLTRTDTLYFTVTVFSTVGFGDITATSQAARRIVTIQMVLDLVVLGLGIRAFIGAVKYARQEHEPPAPSV